MRDVKNLGSHPGHKRRREMCEDLVITLFESESDASQLDRHVFYLESLIEFGLGALKNRLDCIHEKACELGMRPLEKRENRNGKLIFEFGTSKCSEAENCQIGAYLKTKHRELASIRALLETQDEDELTTELAATLDYLKQLGQQGVENAKNLDLCSKAGDLLIALESSCYKHFATLNHKESTVFCQALEQTLYCIRPSGDEVVVDPTESWESASADI